MNDFLGGNSNIKKEMKNKNFSALRISIASPDEIRNKSNGEIKKPETINYRTHKPEPDGLFCAKIFGPVKDYTCLCGKYKKRKYEGLTCEKCGVKITSSSVRRSWMGHIELASPVVHAWFLKTPSKIGYVLNYSNTQVNEILFNDSYAVVDSGNTNYKFGDIISETEYYEVKDNQPENFEAKRGAEAFKDLLTKIDLKTLSDELRIRLKKERSETQKKKINQRLKIVESLYLSGNKPEWMILDVIPVLPPDLRPLVPLEGGRFATSDLNDLYRRIITRNNRLKKLIDIGAPTIIVRNEKRMLQEAVDSLFDNSSMSKPAKSNNGRALKSLTDSLKGKQGRFRQHLLGKRVDYSGRSVITVGPEMKLHQCGLPKKMALELFKPFIFNKLIERGIVTNVKSAKKKVDEQEEIVFEILEDIVKEHPVLLNRAPTLHRLGIQAFEPILVEGKSIKLHPLVCVAFNADFDGDQMAVHLPLSIEAQIEARVLMMSTNNVLSPASGKPIIGPTQDMVLGLYYITRERYFQKGEGLIFSSPEEALIALEYKKVALHAKVKVRINGKLEDTTPGRMLFWSVTPKHGETDTGKGLDFRDINKVIGKKEANELLHKSFLQAGPKATVIFADMMKNLGYQKATESGISISIKDMIIPPSKAQILKDAQDKVDQFQVEVGRGTISPDEYTNKAKETWRETTDKVASEITKYIEKYYAVNPKDKNDVREELSFNPIFIMKDSGARGSNNQIKQLSGMRGLMAKPNGDIIATPIKANFREGLSALEYFISTHGARKGLSDTALKTASSGYLTRKLVDVAHDAIITSYDCGTIIGIEVDIDDNRELKEQEKKNIFVDRILGRTALEDIKTIDGKIIVRKNEEINETLVNEILENGVEIVKIRSGLTCRSRKGVCRKCYGRDLSRRELVNIGEAVGVIAAQSIGEPGTQLVMRVFHQGGIATGSSLDNIHKAKTDGKILFDRISTIVKTDKLGNEKRIVVTRNGKISLIDKNGREKDVLPIEYGSIIYVSDNDKVNKDDKIFESDPHRKLIISEVEGYLKFQDLKADITFSEEAMQTKGATGLENTILKVIPYKGKKVYKPAIVIVDKNGEPIRVRTRNNKDEFAVYYLDADYTISPEISRHILNQDKNKLGALIEIGTVLASKPKAQSKNQDIVAGLPRVEELFEGRKPKDMAVVSEIDGFISFSEGTRTKQKLKIIPEVGRPKLYEIPRTKETIVKDGDFIRAGEPITEGEINPHDILKIKGEKELAKFLVSEIQKVYRGQGVTINDKHIEVIVRQMLKKVQITSTGDSMFLMNEHIDKFRFEDEKEKLLKMGKRPATAKPLLLGISRAALTTESFMSSASFQETTKVLTEAAISGKIDHLMGLKENVMMGRLIPAGTGIENYSKLEMEIVRSKDDIL